MRTIAGYVQDGLTRALSAGFGIGQAQGFFVGRPTSVPAAKLMPVPINFRQRQPEQKNTGLNESVS